MRTLPRPGRIGKCGSPCSGTCVNLQTSKLNCGVCGLACPGNKTCNSGTCG